MKPEYSNRFGVSFNPQTQEMVLQFHIEVPDPFALPDVVTKTLPVFSIVMTPANAKILLDTIQNVFEQAASAPAESTIDE
jgi:hypothetical protein